MVYLGGKPGRADLVKADVLGELQREAIRADSAVEGNEHLALLRVADALHVTKQTCALRQEKLLMIVGIQGSRQRHHDGAAETAVNMVGHNTFQYRAFEDAIQTPIVGIEVIPSHRIAFAVLLGLYTD